MSQKPYDQQQVQFTTPSKNWWILNATKTIRSITGTVPTEETTSTHHYLCYKDDINHIDSMDKQYTIDHNDNLETAVEEFHFSIYQTFREL